MLTTTQKGTAGEEMLAACVSISSRGELELFKPVTDDDHTDVAAGRRGKVPSLAIQVKSALNLNRQGFAVARMYFPGRPRRHPAFIYAIVYVADLAIEAAWLIPSSDFNRLSYRGRGRRGKGLELQFMASPTRSDKWTPFRCHRRDLGSRLLALVDSLPPSATAPQVPGTRLLLRRK